MIQKLSSKNCSKKLTNSNIYKYSYITTIPTNMTTRQNYSRSSYIFKFIILFLVLLGNKNPHKNNDIFSGPGYQIPFTFSSILSVFSSEPMDTYQN